jgi:hypothetical protein
MDGLAGQHRRRVSSSVAGCKGMTGQWQVVLMPPVPAFGLANRSFMLPSLVRDDVCSAAGGKPQDAI